MSFSHDWFSPLLTSLTLSFPATLQPFFSPVLLHCPLFCTRTPAFGCLSMEEERRRVKIAVCAGYWFFEIYEEPGSSADRTAGPAIYHSLPSSSLSNRVLLPFLLRYMMRGKKWEVFLAFLPSLWAKVGHNSDSRHSKSLHVYHSSPLLYLLLLQHSAFARTKPAHSATSITTALKYSSQLYSYLVGKASFSRTLGGLHILVS